MIAAAVALSVVALGSLTFALWRTQQLRGDVGRVLAAMAAEAPCEALSHVRLIPKDREPTTEIRPEDDLFIRMVAALNSFAEDNGYALPVPTLWKAIAGVTAEAILGEDLARIVAGPGLPRGEG